MTKTPGQVAYEAYSWHLASNVERWPDWAALTENQQCAWEWAATAVRSHAIAGAGR